MPLPVVLGHEGAGIVEEVGEGVTRVRPGDHVILTFVPNCGECFHCVRDEAYLCTALPGGGKQRDGTTRLHVGGKDAAAFTSLGCMAEYAVVPEVSVVPIPKDVPWSVAALIGCGVTTGVGAAIKTAAVRAGSTVAVFGCGGVGLSVVQGARLAGAAHIIAVDLSEAKLKMALEFGATETVLAAPGDPVARIRELTGSRGVDYAFEAIGIPSVVEQAYRATRRGGKLTVVGVGKFSEKVSFSALLLSLESKTICGCMYGSVNPRVDFPALLALFRAGKLDLERMVTRTYGIDQAPVAFRDMEQGANARGVIVY
jgi:S-(hydroxymethyl)glutathione dehydrogenase / alcohol dehydrogenase